jgi:hypothetical protein
MERFGSSADVFYSTSPITSNFKWKLFIKDFPNYDDYFNERFNPKYGNYGKLSSFPIQTNIRPAQNLEELLNDIPSKYYRIEYLINILNGTWGGAGKDAWGNVVQQTWNIFVENEMETNKIYTISSPTFSQNNINILSNNVSDDPLLGKKIAFYLNCRSTQTGSQFETGCVAGSNPIEFNTSLTIKLTLYFKEYCSDFLDSPVCINYCLNNIDECIPGNIKYCINDSQPLRSKILDGSSNCFDIVSAYYQTNPNQSQVLYDDGFSRLCSNLQVNPSNFITYTSGSNAIADSRIRQLCACHLNTSVYDNYYQNLTEKVEVLQSLNLGTKQCLFPECGTSLFRSSATIGNNACSSVCLNIFNLKSDGTFIDLNINQSNECESIVTPIQRCSDDSSCSEGKICKNGICERGCNQDSDCAEYQKCMTGICEAYERCELDTQCPSNKKCSNGECILKDRCSKDTDCVSGNVCKDGFCVKQPDMNQIKIGAIVGGIILVLILIVFVIIFIFKK